MFDLDTNIFKREVKEGGKETVKEEGNEER